MNFRAFECLFLYDVFCVHVTSEKSVDDCIQDRCWKCCYYARFSRDLRAEEDEFFREVERARKVRDSS